MEVISPRSPSELAETLGVNVARPFHQDKSALVSFVCWGPP